MQTDWGIFLNTNISVFSPLSHSWGEFKERHPITLESVMLTSLWQMENSLVDGTTITFKSWYFAL